MTSHELNHVALIEPQGDLWETVECDAMERALLELADLGRTVLVDLSETGQITAHGLGLLAHAQQVAHENGGEVTLCGANRAHRLLLRKTGLLDAIRVFPNRARALNVLKPGERAVA